MGSYYIQGCRPIEGEYTVKGAKNAVLPILAASIVTGEENLFSRCPDISDVQIMQEIMETLGCKVVRSDDRIRVDTSGVDCCEVPRALMEKMRSSIFLIGPLLTRCGRAVISQPGGCAIGRRPIDLHMKALSQMGAEIEERDQQLVVTGGRLYGTNLILDFPSVGATENIMLAALGAKGETIIHNSAREPEIVDLQNYLNCCGAQIKGAGTSRIVIKGQVPLHGACYPVMGDRIEAGTFLLAAAATGGELFLRGVESDTLRSLIKYLRFSGCRIKKYPREIWLRAPKRLYGIGRIKTEPYPGFPTDLQPQLCAVMAGAEGQTKMEETIFENRFRYTAQLAKLGADIEILQRTAIIKGVKRLSGARVEAEDLRGGAALVLAGLSACGETIIENIEFIERGYSGFHKELERLGADIKRSL